MRRSPTLVSQDFDSQVLETTTHPLSPSAESVAIHHTHAQKPFRVPPMPLREKPELPAPVGKLALIFLQKVWDKAEAWGQQCPGCPEPTAAPGGDSQRLPGPGDVPESQSPAQTQAQGERTDLQSCSYSNISAGLGKRGEH